MALQPVSYGFALPNHPAPPAAALTYLVGRNGLFVQARSPLLAATLPLAELDETHGVRGALEIAPGIQLRVPRIPALFLPLMVGSATAVARGCGHELLFQVQWAPGAPGPDQGDAPGAPFVHPWMMGEAQEWSPAGDAAEHPALLCAQASGWQLWRPAQTTAPGSVRYEARAGDVLLTAHSHGRMSAFWSETDDADEWGLGVNLLLGDLLAAHGPTVLCRLSLFGYRSTVPLQTVFDLAETKSLWRGDAQGEGGEPEQTLQACRARALFGSPRDTPTEEDLRPALLVWQEREPHAYPRRGRRLLRRWPRLRR